MPVFLPTTLPAASIVFQQAGSSQAAVPPPAVPTSLLVKDRFERAATNLSSAPSYLMATVVNDTTGENKRVCIEGTELFQAIRLQNNWGRGWSGSRENWDKAKRFILGNATRTYHFTKPEAWQAVQPHYTPEMLAVVQERSKKYSTVQLAAIFAHDRHSEVVLRQNESPAEERGFFEASAYVLTDRGLLVGRGDFGNSLYVITPQMLVENDKREQGYAEQKRRSEAEGRAFAARLAGYAALTKPFRVDRPEVGKLWLGVSVTEVDAFTAYLYAKQPRLVNSAYYLNPVDKARKARFDWNQFLQAAAHVDRLAHLHPWLEGWKKAGPNRAIEAQIYGKNLHSELHEDVERNLIFPWKDAGLHGKAYCELILRWQERDDDGWAVVYLPLPGSGETRSLITSVHLPKEPADPPVFWLDNVLLHSDDRTNPQYFAVVVTPDGEWTRLPLPTRRPARPTNQPAPKESKY